MGGCSSDKQWPRFCIDSVQFNQVSASQHPEPKELQMLCLPIFDTLATPGNGAGLPSIFRIKHRPLTASHRQQAGSYKEPPPL